MDKYEVKHLVEMLRNVFDANKETAGRAVTSEYVKTLHDGMVIANNQFEKYIIRLEKLVAEKETYMVEDVVLDGMKEEVI